MPLIAALRAMAARSSLPGAALNKKPSERSSPPPRKPRKPADLFVLQAFEKIGKRDDDCELLDFGKIDD